MPRYYFNVRDDELIPDMQGVILEGPEQAREEADRVARVARWFLPGKSFHVVVADENKQVVFELEVKG